MKGKDNIRPRFYNDGGRAVTDSLEVAERLGKLHKNVIKVIRRVSARDDNAAAWFQPDTYDCNGAARPMFKITRDGCRLLLMCMAVFNDYRHVRELADTVTRFREMETGQKTIRFGCADTGAAELEADTLRRENAALRAEIEELRAKAALADTLTASGQSCLVGELAKTLAARGVRTGQNRLFEWMRSSGYLIASRGDMYNQPTQRAIEAGLFEMRRSVWDNGHGRARVSVTTLVTPKGQAHFIRKLTAEKERNRADGRGGLVF